MKKKCAPSIAAGKKKAAQYESKNSLNRKMSYLKGNVKK